MKTLEAIKAVRKLVQSCCFSAATNNALDCAISDAEAAAKAEVAEFNRAREAWEMLKRPNFSCSPGNGMKAWWSHDEANDNLDAYFKEAK